MLQSPIARRVLPIAAVVAALAFVGQARAADGKAYLGVLLKAGDGGAVVEEVVSGSPAEKSGMKAGDRILAVKGNEVKAPEEVVKLVREASVGDKLALSLKRGEESLSLEVELAARPGDGVVAPEGPEQAQGNESPAFLGIGFADVHPAVAAHLGLDEGVGVAVGSVWKDSGAEKAGLAEHDILLSVDAKALTGPEVLVEHLASKKPGDKVALEVVHRGEKKTVEVALGSRPAEASVGPGFGPWGPGGRGWPALRDGMRRGRIIIQPPDGSRRSFQLPEGNWSVEDLMKEMERSFPDLWKLGPREDVLGKFHKLFGTLKDEAGPGGAWSSSQSSSAMVRVVEGDYDIAIRDQDGVRTVDVKKGDKVLAENMPYAEAKSKLPEDAWKVVEKVAGNIRIETKEGPVVPPAKGGTGPRV